MAEGRLLTWRSGGWVLALAGVLTVTAVVLAIARSGARRGQVVGDGVNVESYRFDLSTLLVPRDRIRASGQPKDGLLAMVDPATLTLEEVRARTGRKKILVSRDLVLGVTVGGESRAYPLRILGWHAIVNDTLGGRPILVAYDTTGDASVVLDRRTGGETLTFGFSGLLLSAAPLVHDRRPGAVGESLWSPLRAAAVAGPAAAKGARLRPLPFALARWADWAEAHPETTVLAPDPQQAKHYKKSTYGVERAEGRRPPGVEPFPPPGPWDPWTRVIAVTGGGPRHVFAIPWLEARTGPDGTVALDLSDRRIRFAVRDGRARLVEAEPPAGVAYATWFAWHAAFPEDRPHDD
jgi:hypothetical protein